MSEKEIIEITVKKRAYERLFSVYDNVDSSVTQEMLDAIEFKDYKDIMNLYLGDPEFGEHVIINICVKIYSLLMTLSN